MTPPPYDHSQQITWVALAASAWAHARHFLEHYKTNLRLKGLSNMNALQLIPVAITLGEDGLKLSQDLISGDKAAAVAAVLDALPAVSTATGKPLADLQALLTAERIGAAFDLLEAVEKIVAAIEAKVAA